MTTKCACVYVCVCVYVFKETHVTLNTQNYVKRTSRRGRNLLSPLLVSETYRHISNIALPYSPIVSFFMSCGRK